MPIITKTKGRTTRQNKLVRGKRKAIKSPNYLTKRILAQAANQGFSSAAVETMRVLGYNIIVQDGWVVKKLKDGSIEKISKLEKRKSNFKIVLD